MAKIDAGKLAGFALLIGGIGWFAWKIPKGAADWKPFFTAGLGLMGATLGAVILFRKIPTAEVGWIDLTKEIGIDDDKEDSLNLKVTAAAEGAGKTYKWVHSLPLGTLVDTLQWRFSPQDDQSYQRYPSGPTYEGRGKYLGVEFAIDPSLVDQFETKLMEEVVCPVCNKSDNLDKLGFPDMFCDNDHTDQKGEYHFEGDIPIVLGAEHRGRDLTPAAKKYVSDKISEIVRDWKKTGRIGSSHPKTLEQAQKQAVAVAYSYAIKAGHKIPKGKIHYE